MSFSEESTAIENQLSHSKQVPVSQKMIEEMKFSGVGSHREFQLDVRRFWELKAQIARDIFTMSGSLSVLTEGDEDFLSMTHNISNYIYWTRFRDLFNIEIGLEPVFKEALEKILF